MTVYRRNPLLMTVMGANPGKRRIVRRRRVESDYDESNAEPCSMCGGPLVPLGQLGAVIHFRCRNCGMEFSRNLFRSNPSLAASLAGGFAGALVTHAMSNPSGPAFVVIDSATGRIVYTKRATGTGDQAIRACRVVAQRKADEKGRPFIVFMEMGRARIGDVKNLTMVRTMGITDEVEPSPSDSPNFRTCHNCGKTTSRGEECDYCGDRPPRRNPLTEAEHRQIVGIARHDRGVAEEYSRIGRPMMASQYHGRAARGLEIAHNFSPRANPGEGFYVWGRTTSVGWYPTREEAERVAQQMNYRGGTHYTVRPAARLGQRDPVGAVRQHYGYAENPGPRGRRKITMTIQQFATWVKKQRDPAMWRAFLAKFRGYEKWTHGAKSRKVTLEYQNVPGMTGLWITYDGGKQPESTYIMPKGSPRKGAWKHPWDTMPDIKHDPEAGVVLTKLRGKSRITDFYHK